MGSEEAVKGAAVGRRGENEKERNRVNMKLQKKKNKGRSGKGKGGRKHIGNTQKDDIRCYHNGCNGNIVIIEKENPKIFHSGFIPTMKKNKLNYPCCWISNISPLTTLL